MEAWVFAHEPGQGVFVSVTGPMLILFLGLETTRGACTSERVRNARVRIFDMEKKNGDRYELTGRGLFRARACLRSLREHDIMRTCLQKLHGFHKTIPCMA